MALEDILNQAKRAVASLYQSIVSSTVDKEIVLAQLRKLNVSAFLLQDVGLSAEITKLLAQDVAVVANIIKLGGVTNQQLAALVNLNRVAYEGAIGLAAEELKSLMIQAVIGDLSLHEFTLTARASGLSPAQANALVNDTLNKFERTVTLQMGVNDGVRLYTWQGPVDDKTSDLDLEIISGNPYTLADFDSQFPGVATNGAHFNCRHFLEPVVV